MARYLLDSTVLIDYLRGRVAVADLLISLAKDRHELGVCGVNVAELYSRLQDKDVAKAEALVQDLAYYPISLADAMQAGRYRYEFARKGITLTVPDTLVAAVAKAQDCIIVTANLRDFPMTEIKLMGQP